ncbi:MAG: hypothetical protein AAF631_10410 [Pseudomonadota bacterium]
MTQAGSWTKQWKKECEVFAKAWTKVNAKADTNAALAPAAKIEAELKRADKMMTVFAMAKPFDRGQFAAPMEKICAITDKTGEVYFKNLKKTVEADPQKAKAQKTFLAFKKVWAEMVTDMNEQVQMIERLADANSKLDPKAAADLGKLQKQSGKVLNEVKAFVGERLKDNSVVAYNDSVGEVALDVAGYGEAALGMLQNAKTDGKAVSKTIKTLEAFAKKAVLPDDAPDAAMKKPMQILMQLSQKMVKDVKKLKPGT